LASVGAVSTAETNICKADLRRLAHLSQRRLAWQA